ncbi:MAG: sdhD [Devosia sp.]|uniref:succinate dehydrogenase, hydrophobic membrane anchor protein n=1 Tax=Devosia sp. TaxID=1871048 RepID=UPI0026239DA4|nr:succinate dehydrogenase, hydrophobic membrane anchor protein [Devosia sp.]MDB5536376.1 sdhD [Devosia sp.]MDB5588948.1 sdhD [Devosia sp.]
MREQIITRDIIADPKSKYGDAKASTRHFIIQRTTGAINIVFLILLLYVVMKLAGQDRVDMVATIGNGWIGIPLAVLLVIATVHMRNGMRDVLEDYFAGRVYSLIMMLNTLFCIIIAVAGVASILKLVFWG